MDIDIAKNELDGKTLVIVKDSKIVFSTSEYGVKDLVKTVEMGIEGVAAADKIVGKAAAMLFVYGNVAYVYAAIISESGLSLLKKKKIPTEYGKIVPNILNSKHDDICPFEKLVHDIEDEKKAYEKIKSFLKL